MNMRPTFRKFLLDETGQDLVEYALLGGLMGLGAVVSIKGVTNSVVNVFNTLGTNIASTT